MRITAATDIGCRHDKNQDSYRAGRLSDDSYWIVLCDGMGGVSAGGEASEMAVAMLEKEIEAAVPDLAMADEIRDFLLAAADRCNRAIFKISRDSKNRITMGTTLVAVVVRKGVAHIVHSGDSRAYHLSDGAIELVTHDHSVVQELLDSGSITPEQAKNHPNRHIITSALGVEREAKLDYDRRRVKKGDLILVCSDGLSNVVEDEELLSIAAENDFYLTAERMVALAVEREVSDNVTAVLLGA